jgi:hypothetical protein
MNVIENWIDVAVFLVAPAMAIMGVAASSAQQSRFEKTMVEQKCQLTKVVYGAPVDGTEKTWSCPNGTTHVHYN